MDLKLINAVAAAHAIESEVLPVVPGRVVHIDGDMLCYTASGKDGTSVGVARNILNGMVNKFIQAARAERAVLQMTASGCLKGDRVLVPTSQPYQGNRKGSKRPANWEFLRDYLTGYDGHAFKVKIWDDREADDGFGYVSFSRPDDVICTNDKDMQMIPGWHLDWTSRELFFVPEDCYEMLQGDKTYGYKWFLLQMLQGDDADNIRGLGKCAAAPRGCGKATARKMLAGTTCKAEGVAEVVSFYKGAFDEQWADEFAEQAIMLWIRRGKSALLDEFTAFTPMADSDADAVRAAIRKIKTRIREQKEEAAALCR